MKLIYLYIGRMDRCIEEQGFSFSDEYRIHYEREDGELIIEKTGRKDTQIYGENIDSVNLLVGRNGCGKTMLLNLLGLPKSDRLRVLPQYAQRDTPLQENAYDWFAVYALEDDLYAVEGYNPGMLKAARQAGYLQNHYSLCFRYCGENEGQTYTNITWLQEQRNADGRKYVDRIFYLTYHAEHQISWYSHAKYSDADDYVTFLFRRRLIDRPGYGAVGEFLYRATHDPELAGRLESCPNGLMVSIRLQTSHDLDADAWKIYGRGGKLLSMPLVNMGPLSSVLEYTLCHYMILRYLEEILIQRLRGLQISNPEVYQPPEDSAPEEERYGYRKQFLLDFMKKVQNVPTDDYGVVLAQGDVNMAEQFCEALEQIPEECFLNGEHVEVNLGLMRDNFLTPLMTAYDESRDEDIYTLNQIHFLRLDIENLSSGEAAFLDLYAVIYGGITHVQHEKDDLCILLLDEPDSSFHPEWSRCLIRNLTELLSSEIFAECRYQMIITTHSPLLLSDVPRQYICCMEKDEQGKVQVRSAGYGFLSNINNILLDSFFVRSPFGAFAEQYVDRLIQELDTMDRDGEALDTERIEELESRIRIIDEPVIRAGLEEKLYRRMQKKQKIERLREQLRRLEEEE